MILQTLATGLLSLAPAPHPASGDLFALRVGKAETIANGTIEHAVILIENGKIVEVGEDLPIERGIRVIDRPDWVVTPGWVNCRSRIGMDSRGGRGFEPHVHASEELYARQDVWAELLEAGITTIGLRPPGDGIGGHAVAIKPYGDSAEAMIVEDPAYLHITLITSPASKKMLRDAFEELTEYDEKVAKAREKWEKDQEKKKKKSKSKKDDDKDDDKDEDDEKKEEEAKDEGPDYFVKPEPDEKVAPFLALRAKELSALMSIRKASDYLHLLDALGDNDIDWSLHAELRDDIDLYEVAERIGEAERRVVMNAMITLQPSTRRERNLPAEFDRAGASVALLPRDDSELSSHRAWVTDVGHLVRAGLDRQAALAGMTLEPAHVLGLADRLGSIEKGKDANLILWNGDPFEPQSRIQAVMLEGDVVSGEVGQ